MTCESRYRGTPCQNEADCIISSRFITRHATCVKCLEKWKRLQGPDDTDPKIEPLECVRNEVGPGMEDHDA